MLIDAQNRQLLYNGPPDWHGTFTPTYVFAYSAFYIDDVTVYGHETVVVVGLMEKEYLKQHNAAYCILQSQHGDVRVKGIV